MQEKGANSSESCRILRIYSEFITRIFCKARRHRDSPLSQPARPQKRTCRRAHWPGGTSVFRVIICMPHRRVVAYMPQAGLLTQALCVSICLFAPCGQSAMADFHRRSKRTITAAASVPDSHRLPFSVHTVPSRRTAPRAQPLEAFILFISGSGKSGLPKRH